MPTFNIQATDLEDRSLRKFAVSITRYCQSEQIDPRHVVVIGTPLPSLGIFSGGMPHFDPNRPSLAMHVECTIGRHRDDAFVERLVTAVVEAGTRIGAGRVMVRIERVSAQDFYIHDGATTTRADHLTSPEDPLKEAE